jgi:hypothetical protein
LQKLVVFGKKMFSEKNFEKLFHIFFRETMANRTAQVSECLNKLYDLMPDGIITYEVSKQYNLR